MIEVNGEAVDPALIDEAFQRLKSEAELAADQSCCERNEEFVRRAEDEVIEGVLLSQEAERRVPPPDSAEIRPLLEQRIREWREHGASWELIEARQADLRADLVSRWRMERFTEGVWSSLPPLKSGDLRAFHREHADAFRRPARARITHLIAFPGEDPAATYRRLVALRTRALTGADFAELAAAHTEKPDGGTDPGWIERLRVLDPFEAMLFSLREGEISPVFAYERAFHLLRLETLEAEQLVPFEEVEDDVRERALAAQRRAALANLAAELRGRAAIRRHGDDAAGIDRV